MLNTTFWWCTENMSSFYLHATCKCVSWFTLNQKSKWAKWRWKERARSFQPNSKQGCFCLRKKKITCTWYKAIYQSAIMTTNSQHQRMKLVQFCGINGKTMCERVFVCSFKSARKSSDSNAKTKENQTAKERERPSENETEKIQT